VLGAAELEHTGVGECLDRLVVQAAVLLGPRRVLAQERDQVRRLAHELLARRDRGGQGVLQARRMMDGRDTGSREQFRVRVHVVRLRDCPRHDRPRIFRIAGHTGHRQRNSGDAAPGQAM
jgi:hypothetical protein